MISAHLSLFDASRLELKTRIFSDLHVLFFFLIQIKK